MANTDTWEKIKAAWLDGSHYLGREAGLLWQALSISQKVELADLSLNASTLSEFQKRDRAKDALGDLKYGSQDSCRMWWSTLAGHDEVLEVALGQGLHLRYFTPMIAREVVGRWIERSIDTPKPALLVWDKAASGYSRPSLLPLLLDVELLGAAHDQVWGDRIMEAWHNSPVDVRFDIFKVLAEDAKFHMQDTQKRKWILHWCGKMFETEAYPTMLVCQFQGQLNQPADALHPDIEQLAISMEDAASLRKSTKELQSSTPRPRI